MSELPDRRMGPVIGWVVVVCFLALVIAATAWFVRAFLVGC